MAQPLSIEDPNHAFLLTTRTIASRLWFVHNPELFERILAYLAKYQAEYNVILYAFCIMGNHIHLVAQFPNANRAQFKRAFNSMVAKLVAAYEPAYPGGRFWGRRYSAQKLGDNSDITHWSLYTVLNSVSSGLCRDSEDYYGYNSFEDSLAATSRTFKVINWTAYHARVRHDASVRIEDFTKEYSLTYSRLPEYQDLSLEEYREKIRLRHEERRAEMIAERLAEGFGFASLTYLKNTKPGDLPRNSKTSTRKSFRPLVLSRCRFTWQACIAEYFDVFYKFKQASKAFLAGALDVIFPLGTYPPSRVSIA